MYKIDQVQINQLVEYMARQPYAEVFRLIGMLGGLTKLEEPKEADASPSSNRAKDNGRSDGAAKK